MGQVFLARDTTLRRDVALKVLPPDLALDPDRLARFRREALVLAKLSHPHIAQIFGLEESDGIQALVLEYIEGTTLAERLAMGPLPIEEALAVAEQIARAKAASPRKPRGLCAFRPHRVRRERSAAGDRVRLGRSRDHGHFRADPRFDQRHARRRDRRELLGQRDARVRGRQRFRARPTPRAFSSGSTSSATSSPLGAGPDAYVIPRVSPDGLQLLYREEGGPGGLDIGVLTLGPERSSAALIRSDAAELNPELAPNGRWLAYESNQSGRSEIYVRPFPAVTDGLWQVSADGGAQPAWSKDARELYFRGADGSLMMVAVEEGTAFVAGTPTKILDSRHFEGSPFRSYDVSPDGERFLMITRGDPGAGAAAASIVVVQNWFEELRSATAER